MYTDTLNDFASNEYALVISAWEAFVGCPSVRPCISRHDPYQLSPLDPKIQALVGQGLGSLVEEWYLDIVRCFCAEILVPRFWNHFLDFETTQAHNVKPFKHESRAIIASAFIQLNESIANELVVACWLQRAISTTSGISTESNLLEDRIRRSLHSQLLSAQPVTCPSLHTILARLFIVAGKRGLEALGVVPASTSERVSSTATAPLPRLDVQEEPPGTSYDSHAMETSYDEDVLTVGTAAMDLDDDADGEDLENEDAAGPDIDYRHLCTCLHHLSFAPLLEEAVGDAVYARIERQIEKRGRGLFTERLLPSLMDWVNRCAWPWLTLALDPERTENIYGTLQHARARLHFFIFETLGKLRISELFDIITDYPDSTPALNDLRICLSRTAQHQQLITRLRASVAQRLLHPGAPTVDIISLFVSMIKALRVLDPSGVLLEAVADPIKQYLRERKDTIRCIVTMLLDDTNHDLFDALRLPMADGTAEGDVDSDDSGDEAEAATGMAGAGRLTSASRIWVPDPVDADPSKTSRSRRRWDLVGTLVNIYGSKEVFVNEYRAMLADKLLLTPSYDTHKEVSNLELLKIRFGESSLHPCDIMLKDVADSRRINTTIHQDIRKMQQAKVEEQGQQ
mmetsp:Transcript_5912/g.9083  ORF Transcript_5912/g.9083 Transcript_5912/m.9083 type:complete len:627 (+) Transcript_5912:83-1963(+)